jgi:hypothetical protein
LGQAEWLLDKRLDMDMSIEVWVGEWVKGRMEKERKGRINVKMGVSHD